MEISKLLELANQILTVVILACGAIGFLFRTSISEWIKSKFSKAVNKELEDQKHQLNKELEAYKVTLVREMEHYKANVDIKRSIALKMADARLEALRLLAAEFSRYHNECCTWPVMPTNLRILNQDEMIKASDSMKAAYRNAEIFLTRELNILIAKFNSDAINLVNDFGQNNNATLSPNDARIVSVMTQYAVIESNLRELIFETPALLK